MSIKDTIKEAVRAALVAHPGASNKDIAEILGCHRRTVGKYARMIKAEWKGEKG